MKRIDFIKSLGVLPLLPAILMGDGKQKPPELLDLSSGDLSPNFVVGDFKRCGTIFSTFSATCPTCGRDKDVFADIKVNTPPDDPGGRVVTSLIFCKACNEWKGWGFRIKSA